MKTYNYTAIATTDLSASDLRAEARGARGARAYTITIYDEAGRPHAESAQALYLPSEGRLGIAWGADASWADVRDVEGGIEMWLNDPDAWRAAN